MMYKGLYTRFARPLLFKLHPETAQSLAEHLLRYPWLWGGPTSSFQTSDSRLAANLAGIPLRNPVGLAAGLDKYCRSLPELARLGFGYLVGGTVLPTPRAGNPQPRLLRLPKQNALINAFGFPSQGADAAAAKLRAAGVGDAAVLVSIAALEVDDFARIHQRLEPLTAGVELNISSPNTAGLAAFQDPSNLREVLQAIMPQRTKPLFVKLPFGHDDASRRRVLALVDVCLEQGIDGVTAGNTLPVEEPRMATGRGGLSGRPILEDMLKTVAAIRAHAGDAFAINACGGVFTGQDALRALQAGATTVQIYTSLVYRGPRVVRRICKEMATAFALAASPQAQPSPAPVIPAKDGAQYAAGRVAQRLQASGRRAQASTGKKVAARRIQASTKKKAAARRIQASTKRKAAARRVVAAPEASQRP